MGAESARRAPSRIATVEDALAALVRNSLDAGAANVFVASWLRSRRFRHLTVIDDGSGIPAGYEERIFEPGVTSRHLDPAPPGTPVSRDPHGSGLSLYHLRAAAVSASVRSRANPTSIHTVVDTNALPERSLQTRTRDSQRSHAVPRTSRSNLQATLKPFVTLNNPPNVYYASPSQILTTLAQKHIIQLTESAAVSAEAARLGLEVSLRTVQRMLSGDIAPARALRGDEVGDPRGTGSVGTEAPLSAGARLRLGREEIGSIQAILDGAARASYLEVGPLRAETRAGAIVLRASVYEPEEIYDDR